ncbi:MAG: Rpn family recombination-promoting nuclease/putative transposase [Muribaculaceae bacterium]|nr:Rpn family recombination-promoting nuclease/putative transposase [Muribaculaceae bacterium]
MQQKEKLIRFDWAIKRLLRHKADHSILEGFLSSLLGRPIRIVEILESESNRDYEENKQNRVDLLAEESDGAKILIEVQNETEDAYFHRMLFGTSRVISEYLQKGDNYDKITKVYSINIVYFNIGEGIDYVYHGTTEFRGLHNKELLKLSDHLKKKYKVAEIKDIFPEYFILRANDFNRWSKIPLDQWMYFLCHSEIPDDADAPGLQQAREQLQVSTLSIAERSEYMHHMREMNSLRDMFQAAREQARDEGLAEGLEKGLAEGIAKGLEKGLAEGIAKGLEEGLEKGLAEGLEKGREEEKQTIALKMLEMGLEVPQICILTGLAEDIILSLKK